MQKYQSKTRSASIDCRRETSDRLDVDHLDDSHRGGYCDHRWYVELTSLSSHLSPLLFSSRLGRCNEKIAIVTGQRRALFSIIHFDSFHFLFFLRRLNEKKDRLITFDTGRG